MPREAHLVDTGSGLAPQNEGWFVVNVADAAWELNDRLGAMCAFEGERAPFAQVGVNVRVLWPGRTGGLYHAESAQEGALVLGGRCLLLVEEHERMLAAWDYVHCPPGTAHAFLAAGEQPCILLLVGARPSEPAYRYPVSELARRHGAGVARETDVPRDAQMQLGIGEWRYERPDRWAALPWA